MKPKTKFWIILLCFYSIGLLALFASCSGQIPEIFPQQKQSTDIHLASTPAPTPTAQPTPTKASEAPVMVCLLLDFSGSMDFYQISPPAIYDLMPLMEDLDRRGGTFGYGGIAGHPTEPFRRLFIPPPERQIEIETATNPFTRKKLRRKYKKELPEYEAREQARRLSNRAKIDSFIDPLKTWLAKPADSRRTDIFSSLTRCNLFLSESPLYWTEATGQTPERFIVAISDGRHTVGNSPFSPVDRGIRVLVVTGRKGIGNFEKLRPDPMWFENSGAAIRHIVATINRRK